MTTSTEAPQELEVGPEVVTTAGRVRGIRRQTDAAFLGIPFAAPPVGPNRFAAPAPVEPWEGVRDATRFGPTPQRRPFGPVTTIPEPSIPGDDTLSVNVFTPTPGDRDARLPVLVWIHGGGFFAGSPASPWYDGVRFGRDGIVTVTLSYRLGFDGFGWIDGAPRNRGILDQIAALEWVRDNIAAFGGDPGRVTIAGQSAGGASVLALLAAPSAAGLFHGAISESGLISRLSPESARAAAARVAAGLGFAAPDVDLLRTAAESDVLDREREEIATFAGPPPATATELVEQLLDPLADTMTLPFVPVVDGEVLVDIDEAIRTSTVPLLLGTNRNEFVFPADAPDGVGEALAAAGVTPAPVQRFESEVERLGAPFTRSLLGVSAMFRLPAIRVAALRTQGGAWDRTWLYDFAWRTPDGFVPHCAELPFVWDLLDAPGVAAVLGETPPQALADTMHADWVGFIQRGACPWPAVVGRPGGARVYDTEITDDPDAYALERDLAARSSAV